VHYLERVGGTAADDDSLLIGVPSDPQPGPSVHAARLTPHPLGTLSWDSGTYKYDGAGNIVSIGTDNYLYDGVQRLTQSSTQGSAETYTYDGFGNMKTKNNMTIPTIQPSTNRYDSYTYNEAGAVLSDGSYTFTYDALGQPLSKIYNSNNATQEYYIYTASDERIGVESHGWWWWSIRDEGGKVLRQYKSSATNPSAPALWVEDFVWRDGLLLGSQRPVEMGARRHFHLDHLGSPRLITSDNGQMVSYHDYYPFGDEKSSIWQEGPSAGGFDREQPMKFTGHERDYAGGMGAEYGHAVDYMHARYYSPTFGRFLSVDPEMKSAYAEIPQSWNRYTYVINNPMKYIDLTGREMTCVTVKDDKGKDQQICSDSVDVQGNEPKVSEVQPVLTARDFQQTDLSYLAKPKSTDSHRSHEDIPHIQHCLEGSLAPLIVGGGAIVAGGATMYAGGVLAEAGITAAPASGGTSLVLVPIGVTVMGAGAWMAAEGVTVYTNTFNNWFGTKVPSLSKSYPKYFPDYPAPDDHPCSEQ
jgi:RHS repeat-associated protein